MTSASAEVHGQALQLPVGDVSLVSPFIAAGPCASNVHKAKILVLIKPQLLNYVVAAPGYAKLEIRCPSGAVVPKWARSLSE